jgi:cell division protein FtsW
MHPAEFAKLALVVYLAHWLTRKGATAGSMLHGLVPFLFITGPLLLLVLLEPDLGTTGVLTLTAFTMFFVAGGSLWQLGLLTPLGAAAVAHVVSNSSYQMARVQAFINPWADPQGIGFHTVQGLLAIGSGGVLGIGLGESRQPGALHLPAAQNDFVFAVVAQELGFFGGLAVIGFYLLFAYRGIKIALGAPDTFGALLATGITAWLALQAFINIAVVVVLLPITGITLPFVSAGGSSLLVSFAAVGILLSISRETLPRGNWNDADPDRRRWNRRPRLPRAGRRAHPARAGA